jgi:hypothetical protein
MSKLSAITRATSGRTIRAPYVMRSGLIESPFLLVRDASSWESFSENDLTEYMNRGSELFLQRFSQFMQPATEIKTNAASELQMMLDSLIHARSQV